MTKHVEILIDNFNALSQLPNNKLLPLDQSKLINLKPQHIILIDNNFKDMLSVNYFTSKLIENYEGLNCTVKNYKNLGVDGTQFFVYNQFVNLPKINNQCEPYPIYFIKDINSIDWLYKILKNAESLAENLTKTTLLKLYNPIGCVFNVPTLEIINDCVKIVDQQLDTNFIKSTETALEMSIIDVEAYDITMYRSNNILEDIEKTFEPDEITLLKNEIKQPSIFDEPYKNTNILKKATKIISKY